MIKSDTSFSKVLLLYEHISDLKRLNSAYCIVFVYNSPSTINDQIHASECVYSEELQMIVDSFRSVADYVYYFDGEEAFISDIQNLIEKHQHVLVYSMAQNMKGAGRRSLIPILCDYYGMINIGANTISAILARSKHFMFELTKDIPGVYFPSTHFIRDDEDIFSIPCDLTAKRYLLKPSDESASIGMEVVDHNDLTSDQLYVKLQNYRKHYPIFCVQEYIEGREVAVPLLWYDNDYYCPGISEVDFPAGMEYLDYDSVAMGSYSFCEYNDDLKCTLIKSSKQIARTLGFKAMSRVDYRIKDGIGYVEDINANPTISETNGVNQLFCKSLNADPSCVYRLLVYSALKENNLFEPTL